MELGTNGQPGCWAEHPRTPFASQFDSDVSQRRLIHKARVAFLVWGVCSQVPWWPGTWDPAREAELLNPRGRGLSTRSVDLREEPYTHLLYAHAVPNVHAHATRGKTARFKSMTTKTARTAKDTAREQRHEPRVKWANADETV